MAAAIGLRWRKCTICPLDLQACLRGAIAPFRLPAYRVSGRGLPPLNPLAELAHCL